MSYTLNGHCIGALSVRSFVHPSVSQSIGPSIGPFVVSSAGYMHRCLPVRLVFETSASKPACLELYYLDIFNCHCPLYLTIRTCKKIYTAVSSWLKPAIPFHSTYNLGKNYRTNLEISRLFH